MTKLLLLLAVVAACSPDKTGDASDTESTTASTAATSSTASESTSVTGVPTTGEPSTGDATTIEPTGGMDGTTGDPADYEALGACAVDMVCEEFIHDDGEVQGHGDQPPGFLDVERCILTGLRDSTPGRYIYGVTTYTAGGNGYFKVQFVVHADRTVTFAEHDISDFFNPGDPNSGKKEIFTSAQTCQIVDAPFFDDCFMNHDDESHYPDCMRTDHWWTGCVESEPRCE